MTDRAYLDYLSEQLSFADGKAVFRPMMGEYLLYYCGKLVGGVYDCRLLVKPTERACALSQPPVFEIPYPGAKPMLLVEQCDDADFLARLMQMLYEDLPEPKKRVRKKE